MNILIALDQADIITQLKQHFHHRGDTVATVAAADHQQWASADAQKFDVVLTDLDMSITEGLCFVQTLWQNGFATPMIVLTQDEPDTSDKSSNQLVEYISKPIELLRLDSIVTRLVASSELKVPETPAFTLTTADDQSLTQTKRPHILIVDDDLITRKILFSFLSIENYQTSFALDGHKALVEWQSKANSANPYDLLIIDLQMPNMDGDTLIECIRQTDPHLPILVLTGHADLSEAYRLLKEHNISDFLTKPLDGSERLLFTVKNILEKFQLTQALKSLNNELELHVRQRTRQLQLAKEEAEAANEIKNQFLTRMGHELRTPLNAIIGFAQLQQVQLKLLQQQQPNSKAAARQGHNANHIYDAGVQLLTLVNDLIDTHDSQIHHTQVLTLQSCSLAQAIGSSIRFLEALALEHQVVIRCHDIAESVIANPYSLKQVFINLLSNAIKYNHRGGIVDISAKLINSDEVEVAIKDSGVGISAEEKNVIFEPFNRLVYAEHSEISGTGVGLTLSKFLVQQMKGSISLDSEPGCGSTFWLRFGAA